MILSTRDKKRICQMHPIEYHTNDIIFLKVITENINISTSRAEVIKLTTMQFTFVRLTKVDTQAVSNNSSFCNDR